MYELKKMERYLRSRKCVIPVVCMKQGKWYLIKPVTQSEQYIQLTV